MEQRRHVVRAQAELAAEVRAGQPLEDGCPPCRQIAPLVDALARELAPAVLVAEVDADAEPSLAARFGLRGLPTLLVFRDGTIVDRIVGALPAALLRARIQAARRPADPLA